jgi:hypothetical protein
MKNSQRDKRTKPSKEESIVPVGGYTRQRCARVSPTTNMGKVLSDDDQTVAEQALVATQQNQRSV